MQKTQAWEAIMAILWVTLVPALVVFALYNGVSEERILTFIESSGVSLAIVIIGVPAVFLYRGSIIDFVKTYRQATELPEQIDRIANTLKQSGDDLKIQVEKGVQGTIDSLPSSLKATLEQELDQIFTRRLADMKSQIQGELRHLERIVNNTTLTINNTITESQLGAPESGPGYSEESGSQTRIEQLKSEFDEKVYSPAVDLFNIIHRELYLSDPEHVQLVKRGGSNRVEIIEKYKNEFGQFIRQRINDQSQVDGIIELLRTVLSDYRKIFQNMNEVIVEERVRAIAVVWEKYGGALLQVLRSEQSPDDQKAAG